MDNLNKLNGFNNLKTLNDSNGNSVLISNGISSLNFDGNIPKRSTVKNVSQLIRGDIVTDSDIVKANKSFLITTIEKQTYSISGSDTDVYFLYYLSDTDGEKPLTYLSPYTVASEPYYGGYNTDQLFYVFSDDIDNINLGDNGWMISNSGNAIFANGFFRGRIEATEGIFSGTVTAGTEDAFIKIGRDLFNLEQFPDTGTEIVSAGNEAHGLIIDDNNYFFTSIYNNTQNITSLTIADETSYQESDKTYEYYATISYTSPFSFDQNINPNTLINQSSNLYISQLLDTETNTDFSILNTERFPTEAGVLPSSVSINGNVSRSNTTATINCTNHGLVAGDVVVISGLTNSNAPLNGTWTVVSSANANIFTFNTTTSGTISANTPSGALSTKAGSFKIKLPYQLTQYALDTNIYITGYANNNLFPEPISLVKIKLTKVEVPKTTSTCQLTVGFNPTTKYSVGENIYLTGFTSSGSIDLTALNGSFKIIALTSSTITVRSFRMTAGTAITTGLGSIQDTLQKSNFKVGSTNNYMSYDSYTDILKVTGEINATSGTFNGTINANSGNIGGFTLSNNLLSSSFFQNALADYNPSFITTGNKNYIETRYVGPSPFTPTINWLGSNQVSLGYTTTLTSGTITNIDFYVKNADSTRINPSTLGLINGQSYTFSAKVSRYASGVFGGSGSVIAAVRTYDASTNGNLIKEQTFGLVSNMIVNNWYTVAIPFTVNTSYYYEFIIRDPGDIVISSAGTKNIFYIKELLINQSYPAGMFSLVKTNEILIRTNPYIDPDLFKINVNNSTMFKIDEYGIATLNTHPADGSGFSASATDTITPYLNRYYYEPSSFSSASTTYTNGPAGTSECGFAFKTGLTGKILVTVGGKIQNGTSGYLSALSFEIYAGTNSSGTKVITAIDQYAVQNYNTQSIQASMTTLIGSLSPNTTYYIRTVVKTNSATTGRNVLIDGRSLTILALN